MRVLVVDDFVVMRKIIKNVLKEIDIENTVEAGNGKEALQTIRSCPVDLIISDWIMPEMTGKELLRACKEDPSIRNIPFIMVAAEAQKDSVSEAIRGGVDNYIIKPFTPEKLREAIARARAHTGSQIQGEPVQQHA